MDFRTKDRAAPTEKNNYSADLNPLHKNDIYILHIFFSSCAYVPFKFTTQSTYPERQRHYQYALKACGVPLSENENRAGLYQDL